MTFYSIYNYGYHAGHTNLYFKNKSDAQAYAEYLIGVTGDHHKVEEYDSIGFDTLRYGVRYPENPLDFPKEENPSIIYSCGVKVDGCILVRGLTFNKERAEEYAREYILKEYGEKELYRMRVKAHPFYNELPFTREYIKEGDTLLCKVSLKKT